LTFTKDKCTKSVHPCGGNRLHKKAEQTDMMITYVSPISNVELKM